MSLKLTVKGEKLPVYSPLASLNTKTELADKTVLTGGIGEIEVLKCTL